MKSPAVILTFLICVSHCMSQANAQAYFLFPNATEIKTLYPAAKEIAEALERYQTPTTWRSGAYKIVARLIDFRDGKAFFENSEGGVVGVEKSKLSLENQHEIDSFQKILKARAEFVAKYKLEPQIVKLYADMKQAEENVKLQEDLIKDLRHEAERQPQEKQPAPRADRGIFGRNANGRGAARNARPEVEPSRRNRAADRNAGQRTQLSARPISNTVYIMKNGSCSFRQKTFMPVRLGGATKRFDIDERSGVVKNLKLSSDDESVLVIREDSAGHTNLIFLAGGEVGLTASVSDDISITEFFDVVELEFSRGTNADEILTAFGQPTDRKQHVFEWPASGSIDGISYVPTINQKTLSAEHWHFRDRPGLVVSIVNDRLYNVGAKSD